MPRDHGSRNASRRGSVASTQPVTVTSPLPALPSRFSVAELRRLGETYKQHLADVGTITGLERLLDDASLLCAPLLISRALEVAGVPVLTSDPSRLGRNLTLEEFYRIVEILGTPAKLALGADEADHNALVEVLSDLDKAARASSAVKGVTSRPVSRGADSSRPESRGNAQPHAEDLLRDDGFKLPLVEINGKSYYDPSGGRTPVEASAAISIATLTDALRAFDLKPDIAMTTGLIARPGSGPSSELRLPIVSLARSLVDEAGAEGRRDSAGVLIAGGHRVAGAGGRPNYHVQIAVPAGTREQSRKEYESYVANKADQKRRKAAKLNVDALVHGTSMNAMGGRRRASMATLTVPGTGSMSQSTVSLLKPGASMRHPGISRGRSSASAVSLAQSASMVSEDTRGRRRSTLRSTSSGHSGGDPLSASERAFEGIDEDTSEPDDQGGGKDHAGGYDWGRLQMVSSITQAVNSLAWGNKPRSPRPWQVPPSSLTPDPALAKRKGRRAKNLSRNARLGISDEDFEAEIARRGLRSTRHAAKPAPASVAVAAALHDPSGDGDVPSTSLILPQLLPPALFNATSRQPDDSASNGGVASARSPLLSQRSKLSGGWDPAHLQQRREHIATYFVPGGSASSEELSPERRRQIDRWMKTKRSPAW
jgi:hypothetical protein